MLRLPALRRRTLDRGRWLRRSGRRRVCWRTIPPPPPPPYPPLLPTDQPCSYFPCDNSDAQLYYLLLNYQGYNQRGERDWRSSPFSDTCLSLLPALVYVIAGITYCSRYSNASFPVYFLLRTCGRHHHAISDACAVFYPGCPLPATFCRCDCCARTTRYYWRPNASSTGRYYTLGVYRGDSGTYNHAVYYTRTPTGLRLA